MTLNPKELQIQTSGSGKTTLDVLLTPDCFFIAPFVALIVCATRN